jgi:N-acetylneuraminate lyase
MPTATFEGILPAVITPFDADGNFAPAAFERLLEKLYAVPIDGLYVSGQTGEGHLQPVCQRKQSAEIALRCSPPGKTVVIHVGAYRTSDALELARHAASIGAHAVASLPPLGSYSFAEVEAYYRSLAAVSDVPILVYYFPAISPVIRETQQALDLLAIPNVIGFKFTDHNLYQLSQIKKSGAVIFNGHDEVLTAGLLMGADGGIGSFYNLIPELFVEAFRLARQGQWERARHIQKRINELVEIVLRFPLTPAIKLILSWTGMNCGRCLEPRRSLTPQEESCLRAALRDSSFASLAG